MDLGFEVVKTKDRPYWHRKDGGSGIYPADAMPESNKEDEKQTEAKVDYPTLVIDNCPEELHSIPEEGVAIIRYKVSGRSMAERDGKKSHNIVIDIKSFEPRDHAPKRGERLSAYMNGRMHTLK